MEVVKVRIREIARERGMTLSSVAKKINIHRSNMSAIASGARGVSLRQLQAMGEYLGCGLDELLSADSPGVVFKDSRSESRVLAIEGKNFDGSEKTWVHNLMVSWMTHYRKAARAERHG